MRLSDIGILKEQKKSESVDKPLIHPFNEDNLQPASYDITLGPNFLQPTHRTIMDPVYEEAEYDKVSTQPNNTLYLPPLTFILGETVEWFNIPHNVCASLDGKSSLARRGLFVHITAGFFDPGFSGLGTLEIFNGSNSTIILRPGMLIAQMGFQLLDRFVRYPYNGKYQNQPGVTGSRYHVNYEGEKIGKHEGR